MKLAYHFVGDKLRDGRPIPADGEWLVHDGEAVICDSGLHASWHPFDALQFAPGSTLCLVEVEDIIDEHPDKLVAKRRKIVARIDAEPVLRAFARWCASQVIDLWDAPNVVREYLQTGDESLRDAAWEAAREIAESAWAAESAESAGAAAWAARATESAKSAWAAEDAREAQRNHLQKLVDDAFAQVQS